MTPELWALYRQPSQQEVMRSKAHKSAIDAMVPFLAAWRPVLCVGCGDGTELDAFPGSTGLTLNATGLQGRRNVVVGDMHCLPFHDRAFGAIFCKDTFEHALAPTIVLAEFSRVARSTLFLAIPDQSWASSPHHTIIPTQDQMRTLLAKAGWPRCRGGHVECEQADDETGAHKWRLDLYLAER